MIKCQPRRLFKSSKGPCWLSKQPVAPGLLDGDAPMSGNSSSTDTAFTEAVKAIQARKGSRQAYARVEAGRGWSTEIDDGLAAFLDRTNSFYLAAASAAGQPYIQHLG